MPSNCTHHLVKQSGNQLSLRSRCEHLFFSADVSFTVWVARRYICPQLWILGLFFKLEQIHYQVGHGRLIDDSGMLNSHIGIWPTVTLFCTLPAASYTDNYQRLIYRCQRERKWSEWLPTELGIGFYQESWRSMFVLREKKKFRRVTQ
jgi:hypothetical protein